MKNIAIFFYITSSGKGVKMGGAERRLSRILNNVEKEGYEVDILLFNIETKYNSANSYRKFLKQTNMNLIEIKSYKQLIVHMITKKYKAILYTDPYRASLPFIIMGVLTKADRILLNVTTYTSTLKFNSIMQKYLFHGVFLISNKVDVLYPSGYKILKNIYKDKKISLTPIPSTNIVDFQPNSKVKTIVFLGSLEDIKNPLLFVDSIILIKEELREQKYKVLICGSGSLEKEIKKRVQTNELIDLITVMGQVDSERILPSANIFVSIQNFNNYPSQSLLEAISSGCYIVASNEGDTKLLIKSEFGELVNLNKEEIAQGILKYLFLEDSKKIIALNSARDFALENFEEKNSVNHYIKLLR